MANIILNDISSISDNLLPLTFTRPVAELRIGISTVKEKWSYYLPGGYTYHTSELLSSIYPCSKDVDNIIISSNYLPSECLAVEINKLKCGERLILPDGRELARRGNITNSLFTDKIYHGQVVSLSFLFDIFLLNDTEIRSDFEILTQGRHSQPLPSHCSLIGDSSSLFIEEGAKIEGARINVTEGPVYIGRNSHIMEGACLRGPIAICEEAEIKMGSLIYPGTTIGPHCKVGGEVSNTVFIGHSNKAHDGFLGNSIIGEWCNIGAGCEVSNLKNDYSEIKLWNYPSRRFLRTGLQFCGMIMGDHSKLGINTMINTATVFGVGVNFHGAGYPRNFVPSFTEGSVAGMHEVPIDKFLDIASRVLARRGLTLSPTEIAFYKALHSLTDAYR